MPHRFAFVSLLALLSLGSSIQPALSQALVPHVLQFDNEQLKQTGLALAQEAAQLAQFQQFEPALSRARLATQFAPQAYETWAILGVLYSEVEQPGQGVAALERARALSPKSASVLFSLGTAYFQQNNYQAAIRVLQEGLALKPSTPEALFDLGNAHYKLGQYQDAVAQYSKAVTLDRKFWPAINNIGLIKYEMGDVAAAMQQWQAAIALDSKAGEPRLALAVALYAQGRQAQAVALAEAALKLDSSYADVNYLKENLWGARLVADAQKMLATPRLQATIAQIEAQQPSPANSSQ
ncbi:MAG TPA: tetratricopeptide repeat protein [Candidatus Caenarcaniphilales bacterium]